MQANKLDTPRVTINDLPTELKHLVAKYCAESDAIYPRLHDVLRRSCRGQRSAEYHKLRPSAISTLYQVSHEWSNIVAPFRFHTWRMSKCRYSLSSAVPSAAKLEGVNTIIIDVFSPGLDVPRPDLALMSKVSKLVFRRDSLRDIGRDPRMPYPVPSKPGQPIKCQDAVQLYERLSEVDFEVAAGTLQWLHDVLSVVPRLRALRLRSNAERPLTEQLAGFLERVPQIDTLELEYWNEDRDPEDIFIDHAVATPSGRPWPALRTFVWRSDSFNQSNFDFIARFASSLEDLTIEATGVDGSSAYDVPFVFPSFPRLRRLRFTGHADFACLFLSGLSSTSIPALEDIAIEADNDWLTVRTGTRQALCDQAIDILKPLVNRASTSLRSFRFFDVVHPWLRTEVTSLVAFCAEHNVALELSPFPSSFPSLLLIDDFSNKTSRPDVASALATDAKPPHGEGEIGAADLRRTIDFLADWARRAEGAGEGSPRELARVARALQAVEMERLLWEA
ncbi:uncharacterized protein JCM10292_002170 [Rhodotorula paludigena]|uniref:uncharacterized protein n=1 Tax=Rhodotorula paludigena TaxID=86838 RepID=UPI0031740916